MGQNLLLLFCWCAGYHAFLYLPNLFPNASVQNRVEETFDETGAVFLTPLIKQGKIKEAQRLAEVKGLIEDVNSSSGYITVNEKYQSNLFFWYFPALTVPEKDAPVVIWLNGGPGCSSLYGLFTENGPIQVEGEPEKLQRRIISWSENYNMLYIDQPVNVGFSFTKNDSGVVQNLDDVARDMYEFLVQFYQLFPFHMKNELYISGESFAGQYIPAIAYKIHQENKGYASVSIPLTGLAMGNGLYTDSQGNNDDFWNQLGVIKAEDINYYNIISPHSGLEGMFDPLAPWAKWLNLMNVQESIHAVKKKYKPLIEYFWLISDPKTCNKIEALLDAGYKIMIYNGHLDGMLPYRPTETAVRSLKWNGTEDYANAERIDWKLAGDSQVAGYAREVGNLRQVMIRGAGHMVPTDQPERALDMIKRFIEGISFKD